MAKLFLGYANDDRFKNSNGINAGLADAADVAAAKAALKAAAPSGETLHIDDWTFTEYAATTGGAFPAAGVVFFEGNALLGSVQRRGQ